MAIIIIFTFLSVLSLTAMLFLVKRQMTRMGSLPAYYLDDVDPAWKDVHHLVRGSLSKLWIGNAHRVEFLVIVLGKVVVKFLVHLEDVILQFLNFVWGKCKIEKNNSSHYWQMMIRHKKDLNEDSNMGGKNEEKDIEENIEEDTKE